MTSEFVQLESCKPGLLQAAVPVWVNDAETMEIVWANERGVKFWGESNPTALYARKVFVNAPEDVVIRTRSIIEQIRMGISLIEEWTFYPGGKPVLVSLDMRGVQLANGRFGLLNQAVPSSQVPDALRRASAMFRHTAVISVLVRADGSFYAQNPAARTAFGKTPTWVAWFAQPGKAKTILRDALAGETVESQAKVSAKGTPQWHAIRARSLRDPVTGELGVLAEHTDETARVEAEQSAEARQLRITKLRSALDLVEQQRQKILDLSAPILEVGKGVLAVPIIGNLNEEQSAVLSRKLLRTVEKRMIRRVILDLTGIAEFDPAGTTRLQQMIRSLRLLGSESAIAGIRPELAANILDTGVDFDGIPLFQSLAACLENP